MRISDWSSDVCSSDLSWPPQGTWGVAAHDPHNALFRQGERHDGRRGGTEVAQRDAPLRRTLFTAACGVAKEISSAENRTGDHVRSISSPGPYRIGDRRIERSWAPFRTAARGERRTRSEEHTSELQSLMRISYAVFCLKKKKK